MTQSLTDWLQQSRLIVVGVDLERRRVRVKSDGDACTDLSCHERTVVVSEEGSSAGPRRAQSRGHRDDRGHGREAAADRRRPPRLGRATSPEW